MRNNKKKGFTLVELLVVIAILAILATVSTVGYTAFVKSARNSNAATELEQIARIIETDLMDDGKLTIGTTEITMNEDEDALVAAAGVDIEAVLATHIDIAPLLGEGDTLELDGLKLTLTKDYNGAEGTASVTLFK